jgi:hypothetical protein
MHHRLRLPLLVFALNCFLVCAAQAQTTAFTYQGRLSDSNVAASGLYDFQFALYDVLSGGTQIGTTQTVSGNTVTNGIFTVQIDFGANALATGADRYLEIKVKKPADASYTTLTPRQQLTSTPYSVRTLFAGAADSLSTACVGCVTDSQINSIDGSKVTGTVANSAALNNLTSNDFVMKTGDTMTGTLNLPFNGLNVGVFQNQFIMSQGLVGIGRVPNPSFGFNIEKLQVNGNIGVPAANNFGFDTPQTRRLTIGPEALMSANPTTYEARIDDGFASSNVNGLGSLWATGGTAGTVAYFVAPVQLPDGAIINGLTAQLIKNGGSLQSVVELYRSDSTGYLANTANLIATATTTSSAGLVLTVNAASINSRFTTVDNTNYRYFIRYSGEQNTQNLRFCAATITYLVYKVD